MASPIAQQFAATRNPATLASWLSQEPELAARWLKQVATKVGATEVVSAVDAFLNSGAPAGQASDLANHLTHLENRTLGELQAARTQTLGWSASDPMDPPSLTGTIQVEGGVVMLQTTAGRFQLVNGPAMAADSQHAMGATDAQAFAGQTVTVRGWPVAGWAPGAPQVTQLAVEEFGPGSSSDFLCGRVQVEGNEVLVVVRPDKKVKVTDPNLANTLRSFDKLGLILPGAVTRSGQEFRFDLNPEQYYILAGFNLAGNPVTTGAEVQFNLQAGHGKTVPTRMPTAEWNRHPRTQRHYVLGRLEGQSFVASRLSASAGRWNSTRGPQAQPSGKFVVWATSVDPAAPVPFA